MESDISENFLASEAKTYGVTEAEKQALTLALEGVSTAKIAQRLNISPAAVRKRLGEVYRKFGIERKGPGKLAILRRKLLAAQSEFPPAQRQSHLDLGNAPKVSSFIGRQQDLDNLCQWIRRDRCELIAVTGIGGIGKTALILELIKQIKSEFDWVIWRSLRQFDSFQALLESLPDSPTNATIADLFALLTQKRCLLVLDQFDQVFSVETNLTKNPSRKSSRHLQAGVLGPHGNKHEDYKYYRQLLQEVGSSQLENSLHSCIVITSREKPRELIPFEGEHASVRILPLTGLDFQAAHQLLSDMGPLQGNDADKTQLISSYSGNPLALKLATGTIKDLFAGHIQQFLDQQQLVFDDLRDVLKDQFNRLSLLEKETMYWLAINRLPVTFASLQADIVALSNKHDLVYTLRSLEHRSLIEIRSDGAEFTLQPTVMEYVTQHLVKQVVDELSSAVQSTAERLLLNEHSLLKADAAPYVRQQQTEKLLKPVLDALRQTYGSAVETQEKLEIFLNTQRNNAVYKTGYLGGNLVNLMALLSEELKAHKDLSHKDFSHLAIWQADLEGVTLTGTKFNHCSLEKSVFTEMLSDVVSVGFTRQATSFNTLAAPYLAAGDTNGHIHIWNALTYQKRTYWQGHLGWVRSLAFNRDNTLIATGGDDSKLRLWRFHPSPDDHPSLNNISLVWEKNGFPDWVRSVAFHPDQEIVACCSHATIYLYDEHTGQELARLQAHDIEPATPTSSETLRYIAFSPDGDRIASCGDDTNVRVWDWQERKRIFISSTAVGHKNWARAVAFSPCGRYLISSSDDQTVRVWDLDSQTCVQTLRGHTDRVRSVAVSSDGCYMVSGSDDGTVILWDFQKMTQIGKSQIHESRVWSVAFYQHNRQTLLASGGDDRSVVLSNVSLQNGQGRPIEPLKILRGFAMGTRSVAVLPRPAQESGLDLIVSGGNDWRIKLWQCSQGDPNTPIRDLAGHTGRVWSVAAHQGWVASASDDGTVRIWNLENSSCVKVLTAHQHWVRTVAFNLSGTMLASGADDTQIHLWQLPTGIKLHTFDQHQHWIRTLAFSPDGRYLASGGDDKAIYLWDVIKRQSIRKFQQRHQHRIRSVAFRPTHSSQPAHPLLLASGSDDGKVIIWDVETGECLHCFEEQHRTAGVKSVAFSPDGCWMATGSDDHLIYVWETRTADPKTWKEKQLSMPMTIGQPLGIQSLVFMSDSRNLVSCDRSGAIHIIDIMDETRRQIKPQRPYENMQIKGITGIDPVQRVSLKDLGAIDAEDLSLSLIQRQD